MTPREQALDALRTMTHNVGVLRDIVKGVQLAGTGTPATAAYNCRFANRNALRRVLESDLDLSARANQLWAETVRLSNPLLGKVE